MHKHAGSIISSIHQSIIHNPQIHTIAGGISIYLMLTMLMDSHLLVIALLISLYHCTFAFLPTHHNSHNKNSSVLHKMSTTCLQAHSFDDQRDRISNERILFIEVGFGNDSHGQVSTLCLPIVISCFFTSLMIVHNLCCQKCFPQSSTKAAVRACRNAIEFNSIPSIKRLIPDVSNAYKCDV